MNGGRPFAAFDIDGTIIRWQLYHAIAGVLAKQGQIDGREFDRVKAARMSWKQRSGEESFRDYEHQLIGVFDKALKGLRKEDLTAAAETVFNEYKEQVYIFARNLIQELKSKNYLLFAISGSPAVIVQKLADYYGFDDFAATIYPANNGRFIGTKDLSIGKKPELLRQLVSKHSASYDGSIVVGDSEGDISMLELVEQPIAFNPSKQLFSHARERGWKIVIERKNMVYELEPSNGSYVLA